MNFTSVEEFKTYYSKKGFEVVENTHEAASDGLTMQMYSEECIKQVSINFKDGKAEVIEKELPLTTVEDHIKYFQAFGYKLISDSESNGSRNVTLRMYSADDYGEIKIRSSGESVFVTKMINGKVMI
ncbi:MAG: hypothetical protein OEW60_00930 [Thiovulaceae bacterium]|nr:hypothetical protein [Sulfurimonadaceae bacterium]